MINKHTPIALVALFFTHTSFGAVLFTSNFNAPTYSNGSLVGQDGWVAHSGAGATPVTVANTGTNGTISLTQGTGSREDVNHVLGATIGAGETYYAAFDVIVTVSNANVYFAHLKDAAAGTDFGARVHITPFAGSDFTFGISDNSGAAPTTAWATGLLFGTTYTVVTAYERDTGITTLWVNPTSISSTSITSTGAPNALFSTYGFRQGTGSTSVQTIDNLFVGTSFADVVAVPEPSRALLLGLGGLGLIFRRRRQ